ncbi:MAG: DegT/DnrJ/EryC1/StrS family aminotransferase [Dysgonamonadaceae bacterium]|jgi:dTDP-4-amino-4,6-dideoxygalactose transaminase|nr:DegT/DnrJ/EryC1/StrS family aminotransferase [Dysgonamonadaceae bacterium]
MKIQQVDLTTQYLRIQKEMDEAVLQCIRSGAYINGAEVGIFAQNLAGYTGAQYVIPCANGTDALQIALMALDLQPGDEVIVPAFTYVASAEVIALLKLVPVLVDVDFETFNMDVEKFKKAITNKTKAVIPVHLFGQTCDMQPILEICKLHKIAVVEDNAQSIGSVYTFSDGQKLQAGTMGDIGTLSFFPAKNLGCYGDGGAMLTNNETLAGKLKMIASHGQSRKYYHDVVGCNSRLDTLQAAILNVKLKYLSDFIEARQQAATYYNEQLQELSGCIVLPAVADYSTHVYHQYTIRLKEGKRDELKQFLYEKNIPSMIYYPLPLHHQKAFKDIIRVGSDLSQSEQLSQSVLSLPMHTELNKEQQDYIIDSIKQFFNR